MLARLGNVLYWAFSGLAFLIVGLVAYAVVADVRRGLAMENDAWAVALAVILAVVLWLLGRACRYVLAYLGFDEGLPLPPHGIKD
jgi:hypothetical protein